MKEKRKATRIWANIFIVALVVAGTVLVTGLGSVTSSDSSMMTVLFLGFLGAIIAIQVVPCVVLFGAMLKGVIGLVRGKEEVRGEGE